MGRPVGNRPVGPGHLPAQIPEDPGLHFGLTGIPAGTYIFDTEGDPPNM